MSSKLRYYNGTEWEQIAPTKEEFDTHKAYGVSQGEFHELRATNGYLEFFNGVNWLRADYEYPDDFTDSPGNKQLIAGTREEGFFGEVPTSNLISGDALASELGLTIGTPHQSNSPWLKFSYKGDILFVAKKTYRHSISWKGLNDNDLIYGNRNITIDGIDYKVRLLRAANRDPFTSSTYSHYYNSEWNRLMIPIWDMKKDDLTSYDGRLLEDGIPYWGINYTDIDLNAKTSVQSIGSATWCQEKNASGSHCAYRGYNYLSNGGASIATNSDNDRGWRPVLEVIQ